KKFKRPANASAIGGLIIPEIYADKLTKQGKLHQPVKISDTVAPCLGTGQLQRLASIRLDLQGDPFLFGRFENILREISFAEKQCERGCLQVIVGAMIIFC